MPKSSRARRMAEGFPGQRLVVLAPALLERARQLAFCRPLMPTHLGRFDGAAGHAVNRPHGRPEHVLIVCLSGAGRVRAGGRTVRMSESMGVVLAPGEAHAYEADAKRPWSVIWMHLTGRLAGELPDLLSAGRAGVPFFLADSDRVVEAFEETFQHVHAAGGDTDLVGLATGAMRFIGVLRTLLRAKPGVAREAEARVLRSVKFMRAHLADPLTIDELALAAGWAPSHYSTVFRRKMQTTPLTFLTRLRLQRACELLKSTNATLADVGAQVGIPDPFYFSRLFRRHLGLPPSEYRALYAG